MEVQIYKENGKYYASSKGNSFIRCSNKDKYCLGLDIAHTIKDDCGNNLEELILKIGEGVKEREGNIVKNQIENSASYGGYGIDVN